MLNLKPASRKILTFRIGAFVDPQVRVFDSLQAWWQSQLASNFRVARGAILIIEVGGRNVNGGWRWVFLRFELDLTTLIKVCTFVIAASWTAHSCQTCPIKVMTRWVIGLFSSVGCYCRIISCLKTTAQSGTLKPLINCPLFSWHHNLSRICRRTRRIQSCEVILQTDWIGNSAKKV